MGAGAPRPNMERDTKMKISAVAVCALGGLAASANAQVTSIGQFTGDVSETFENVAPAGTVPGPVDIFGGEGTVNDELANILMVALNLVSFVTNEEIFPYNGNLMGGSVTSFTEFTFDEPATQFGGYFGTADNLSGGFISFYDSTDELIETQAFAMPLNDWQWFGWSSSTPISRISLHGNANPGSPIVFDDLQVNFVPAPASAMLMAVAGVSAARRRRS